eukprot:5655797-Amphidinium_carterae.1
MDQSMQVTPPRNPGLGTLVKRIRIVNAVQSTSRSLCWFNRQSESRWSMQSICLQDHFGSMNSQNQDGQCSQRQGDYYGSTLGLNHGGQCSDRHSDQSPRLGDAGEDQWISQCSQGSIGSWGAGKLPTNPEARRSLF